MDLVNSQCVMEVSVGRRKSFLEQIGIHRTFPGQKYLVCFPEFIRQVISPEPWVQVSENPVAYFVLQSKGRKIFYGGVDFDRVDRDHRIKV